MAYFVALTHLVLIGANGLLDDSPTHAKNAVNSGDSPELVASALLDAHNVRRAREKLPALRLDPVLAKAAQQHADDMAARRAMSHAGSDGSTPAQRLTRNEYHCQTSGENVAFGWRTVERVMRGWIESPPHEKNILGAFERVGFAVSHDEDGVPYWAAEFATPWPRLDPKSAAESLVEAINQFRAEEHKKSLRSHVSLEKFAQTYAEFFARSETLDAGKSAGIDLAAALKEAGYRYAKIAVTASSGATTAKAVVSTWSDEDANRNALLGGFSDAGAAVAASKTGRPFWCLILASPR